MTARSTSRKPSSRQRGAVLFVSMVVLVALGVAAMALLRSTDVAGLIAGNLSFKRSALNTSDVGVKAGYDYVTALATDTVTPANGCYSANQVDVDSSGIPTLLTDAATFKTGHAACVSVNSDTGETLSFYAERLCAQANVGAYEDKCSAARVVGSGLDSNHTALTNVPPLYRTTIRVDGPRGTTSYSQVIWQRVAL